MSERFSGVIMLALVCASSTASFAQQIDPFYENNYTLTILGAVPGIPNPYGGLTLREGTNNKLLVGGNANTAEGQLWEIEVTRDPDGHINGFVGEAQAVINAPYNDGGLTYGAGGLLWASRWPVNEVAMYKSGSVDPDKVIALGQFGIAESHAALQFVPSGFGGAGRLKMVSWENGEFYDVSYGPDGSGTYDIFAATQVATLEGGPEGFIYVPHGSPLFNEAMLVSEFSAGFVAAYDIDALGNPIAGTRRNFITGLTGAEGAYVDPFTGDFIFSTFQDDSKIVVVRGFAIPEPGTMISLLVGGLALLARRRRR